MRKIVFIRLILAYTISLLIALSAGAQIAPQCHSVFIRAPEATRVLTAIVSEAKVNSILVETLEAQGNFTSKHIVNSSEAIEVGRRWIEEGYSQMGKPDSGVFISRDGKRRFRIDNASIIGAHSPFKPHIHLELLNPVTREMLSNNHVLIQD